MPPKTSLDESSLFLDLTFHVPKTFQSTQYPLRSGLTSRIKRHQGSISTDVQSADIVIFPFSVDPRITKNLFVDANKKNPPARVLSADWIDESVRSNQLVDFDQFDAQSILEAQAEAQAEEGDGNTSKSTYNVIRKEFP